MKILILGHGKSGTTVFLFKVAGGLPNCHVFSGGDPVEDWTEYENAVYKYTYSERKSRDFDRFLAHIREASYDRKIWMARDPRDIAVSHMLYRWHKGHRGRRNQYLAHLDLVQKKEKDPGSIPFHVLCRYIGHVKWPMSSEEAVEKERSKCRAMHDFVEGLGDEWFIFKYEDMIEKNYDRLNDYLGFEIKVDAEIPLTTKKRKVARQKVYGEWRNWFTQEDVKLFKSAYFPNKKIIGYDCSDWTPNPNPIIEPEVSSLYIQNLVRKNSPPLRRIFNDFVLSPFQNRSKQ
jgi:hypothetical protein